MSDPFTAFGHFVLALCRASKSPPPRTPPHKGEWVASASESPSPLWGGVRGGGGDGDAPDEFAALRAALEAQIDADMAREAGRHG